VERTQRTGRGIPVTTVPPGASRVVYRIDESDLVVHVLDVDRRSEFYDRW